MQESADATPHEDVLHFSQTLPREEPRVFFGVSVQSEQILGESTWRVEVVHVDERVRGRHLRVVGGVGAHDDRHHVVAGEESHVGVSGRVSPQGVGPELLRNVFQTV